MISKILLLVGLQLASMVTTISDWRVKNFKEYPYLYEGNNDYEKAYTKSYIDSLKSAVIVAYDEDEKLAGFLTCLPLIDDEEFLSTAKPVFLNAQLDPEKFYYCGEVIIEGNYRKQGIARKLFAKFEEHAKELGYDNGCFVTIEHPENHPLKPKDYEDPSIVWHHFGYEKTDIVVTAVYPTIDGNGFSDKENKLVFWIKKIE
jgi:ribosomal protein S18 acetylase RimI-like enzyme